MIYADDEGARLAGLQIRSEVVDTVDEAFPGCIDCGITPAPTGRYAIRELAAWAESQNPHVPLADALHGSQEAGCASCSSQRAFVIGLPLSMLYRILNSLRPPKRRDVERFLEWRFVFPLCVGCAESTREDGVTVRQIENRYRRARAAVRDADLAPAGIDDVVDELMFLIAEDIRTHAAG